MWLAVPGLTTKRKAIRLQQSFCLNLALTHTMNSPRPPRQNSAAELKAFDTVCERLAGFDPGVSFEWVDGFLTALAAGPQLPEAIDWLPAMFGDAFDRAFADPDDHAQALRTLAVRLKVLSDQLDPAALMEAPDTLRLDPLIGDWSEADRERLLKEAAMTPEEAAAMQHGALWAEGFLDGVEAFPSLWDEPADEEDAVMYLALLDQIGGLLPPAADEAYKAHVDKYYPKGPPSREDLLAEAFWSVQDLRVFWCDHAPKPATRRVEPVPGRNEPCHCGSGKKFKKCHGAAA